MTESKQICGADLLRNPQLNRANAFTQEERDARGHEERSFTIIAYPIPEIGEDFPEIFREIVKINTLDYKKYQKIQQTIIDTLDTCESVSYTHLSDRSQRECGSEYSNGYYCT